MLTVVFLIAAFLRFYDITHTPPGFYPDEAINANNGVEAWETGHFKIFYPENNGREGLWMNIIGFFMFKFGHEPWIPRAIAAVFGLFTVLGVYFLTKKIFSKKIALLSSFFIATSFWHINFSRISFRAILAPAFLVWGLYFLIKTLNQIKNNFEFRISNFDSNSNEVIQKLDHLKFIQNLKLKIKNFSLPFLGGILYGLGFHTYIAYRVTPVLILIILLFYWFQNKEKSYRQKIIIPIALFLVSAFVVAAPLFWYFLKNPQDFLGRTSQISVFSSPNPVKTLGINILKTAGMFNFAGDSNWRHNYPSQPELFWPVGILFLLGSFLGIRSIIKKIKAMEFSVLFGWFAFAALPVVVSNEGLPHALRAILMIPPIFILAGIGGARLYKLLAEKIKNQRAFNIFVLIFLSLLAFQAYTSYFILWGGNPNTADAFNANYVAIGRQINNLTKETPKYVIVKASGVLVRGIPMPAETIMFITDTFTPKKQKEKNIFYILPDQINQIPVGAFRINLE